MKDFLSDKKKVKLSNCNCENSRNVELIRVQNNHLTLDDNHKFIFINNNKKNIKTVFIFVAHK